MAVIWVNVASRDENWEANSCTGVKTFTTEQSTNIQWFVTAGSGYVKTSDRSLY